MEFPSRLSVQGSFNYWLQRETKDLFSFKSIIDYIIYSTAQQIMMLEHCCMVLLKDH